MHDDLRIFLPIQDFLVFGTFRIFQSSNHSHQYFQQDHSWMRDFHLPGLNYDDGVCIWNKSAAGTNFP